LQVAVDLHATVRFGSGTVRQTGFRAQARGGNHHIHLNMALTIKRGANAVSVLPDFAAEISAADVRPYRSDDAVSDCLLLLASALTECWRVVDQGDGFTRAAEIHRQLGANQAAADNHHPLRVTKPGFAGLILLLAVERHHQLATFNRWHKRDAPVASTSLSYCQVLSAFTTWAAASISVTQV
jgi:hypothetical protein